MVFFLYSYYTFDVRMWIVVDEFKVFVLEIEDTLYFGVNFHLGQGAWLACELKLHLLQVIAVDVCVAEGMYKLAWLETCHLSYHHE